MYPDDIDDLYDRYGLVRPSFAEGAARMVDLSGSPSAYHIPGDGAEADARAIASDWAAVGRDLGAAMGQTASASDPSTGRRRRRAGRAGRHSR